MVYGLKFFAISDLPADFATVNSQTANRKL